MSKEMANHSSALLINEDPLQVLPSLAVAIGLNEAIALQQLHYWLRKSKNLRDDGRKWVYNSYGEWAENFPFWSERTIQRAFLELEKRKLIIVDTPGGRDRRKWYTIDYDRVNGLISEPDTHTPQLPEPEAEAEADIEPTLEGLSTCQDGTVHDAMLSLSDVPSWHDASRQPGTMEDATLARPSRQHGTMFKGSETTTETTQENTHTHPAASGPRSSGGNTARGVGVSKFNYQERLTFARNQQGIDKPVNYANSAPARSGEFDEAIQIWYEEQQAPAGSKPARDTSACPDCHGNGMYYPEGKEKGVAKCRHPRLDEAAA